MPRLARFGAVLVVIVAECDQGLRNRASAAFPPPVLRHAASHPLAQKRETLVHRSAIALAAILAAGALTTAPAHAQAAPAKVAETTKGKALVDEKGMTLYVFDRDAGGKSNCTGQCAQNWPPFAAPANAQAQSDWTVI